MRIKISLDNIPEELRPFVNIYSNLIEWIGTKQYKYNDFSRKLLTCTGGISTYIDSYTDKHNQNSHHSNLLISSHFFNENIDKAFALISSILSNPDFTDYKIFSDSLMMVSTNIASSIPSEALSYALSYSQSGLRSSALSYEKFRSDIFLCSMATQLASTPNNGNLLKMLSGSLVKLTQHLFRNGNISFSVHGDVRKMEFVNAQISNLIESLKSENSQYNDAERINAKAFQEEYMSTYFKLAIDVNHCVQSYKIPIYTHSDFSKIAIGGYLLNYAYLHPLIREKGGAYGAGCQINESGLFSFYSYRDPHTKQTYKAFEQSLNCLKDGKFTELDIKEAKLLAFSKIDKPIASSDEGMLLFTRNYTNQERQTLREQLIDVTKDDIVEGARQHLVKGHEAGKTSKIIAGIEDPEKSIIEGWKTQSPLSFNH